MKTFAQAMRVVAWVAALAALPLGAQIRTDATLGRAAQALAGPQFVVPETLGALRGSNLFHSFSVFNIHSGESATFTTTTRGIGNVISRVTGGDPSFINGALRLEAGDGAPNFFFINPAGVTFGAGASIDVPGAFHVSTADYVKFADGKFYANGSSASVLSSVPPEAFGFLGTTRGTVAVKDGAMLSTNLLQPFSIVAGDVEIDGGIVSTKGGDIRMVALGQHSQEVGLAGSLPAADGHLQVLNGGQISSPAIDAHNAGNIAVSAGDITIGGGSRGGTSGILSQANAGASGNSGSVNVMASGSIEIVQGGAISSDTFSSGNAGAVSVTANQIRIDGQGRGTFTGISSSTSDSAGGFGSAGKIVVLAHEIAILNGGSISSTGGGGSIDITGDDITIDGGGYSGSLTGIIGQSALANGNFDDFSPGAPIRISAGNLFVSNGGLISSDTYTEGDAGLVQINARNITIDGSGSAQLTGIVSRALDSSLGFPGKVEITATGNLQVLGGGMISSSSNSYADAGFVTVSAGSILVDGRYDADRPSSINSRSLNDSYGMPGRVTVTATDSIILSNGGELSITNSSDTGSNEDQYFHNFIAVSAPVIRLINGARISAEAPGNKDASNVRISFGSLLSLVDSSITTSANQGNGGSIEITGGGTIVLRNSQVATSVTGRFNGNGGDIDIHTGALVMDTGFIQANTVADSASGGNVAIDAQTLVPSGNTLFVGGQQPFTFRPGVFGFNVIQAAAPTGVSGAISITVPALDVSGGLTGINAKVLDAGGLGRSPCEMTGSSSLAQAGRGGLPPSAGDFVRAEPVHAPGVSAIAPGDSAAHSQKLACWR